MTIIAYYRGTSNEAGRYEETQAVYFSHKMGIEVEENEEGKGEGVLECGRIRDPGMYDFTIVETQG